MKPLALLLIVALALSLGGCSGLTATATEKTLISAANVNATVVASQAVAGTLDANDARALLSTTGLNGFSLTATLATFYNTATTNPLTYAFNTNYTIYCSNPALYADLEKFCASANVTAKVASTLPDIDAIARAGRFAEDVIDVNYWLLGLQPPTPTPASVTK
jgi:hypothetical protein